MSNRVHGLLAILALAGLVAMAGCQQRQEVEDDMGADTTEVLDEDTTMMAPPSSPGDAGAKGAAGTAEVSVTNTMPHAMIVKADHGEGEHELGTVAPNETKSFSLTAAEGTQVTLTAADSGNTHSVNGTVTTSATTPATWTIQ